MMMAKYAILMNGKPLFYEPAIGNDEAKARSASRGLALAFPDSTVELVETKVLWNSQVNDPLEELLVKELRPGQIWCNDANQEVTITWAQDGGVGYLVITEDKFLNRSATIEKFRGLYPTLKYNPKE
jgi:hypothetical protein